jgi:hypothetical protein
MADGMKFAPIVQLPNEDEYIKITPLGGSGAVLVSRTEAHKEYVRMRGQCINEAGGNWLAQMFLQRAIEMIPREILLLEAAKFIAKNGVQSDD